jgi:hydrogenase expression/formation protein HypC
MCLAVPLEIVALTASRKALVRRGEGSFEIDVSLLEAPRVGDFVLVHAGFAIETLDSDEAAATLRELDALEGGPGAGR